MKASPAAVVAALQMNSGPDVAANLATAAGLLAQARDAGARVAVLPENFSFIGRRDADKRAIAEPEGDGAGAGFPGRTGAVTGTVDRRWDNPARAHAQRAGRRGLSGLCRRWSADGALRQDPSLRRGHSRSR